MFSRKLYLDEEYREILEQIALREGLIDKALPYLLDTPFFQGTPEEVAARNLEAYTLKRPKVPRKHQFLQMLMLFDNIDAEFSILDWSRLVEVDCYRRIRIYYSAISFFGRA
jgi:hypothetical protein